MGNEKSPGPDGYTVMFYKTCWEIVQNDVADAVRSFFEDGKLPKFVNSAYLALVPKKPNATSMRDYRPIS
ncbi:Transposon TX1 uncharacterized 149 kDa protein [Linum perenne]